MALRALIYGMDFSASMKPLYDQAVKNDIFEIVAETVFENGKPVFVYPDGKRAGADNFPDVDFVIISRKGHYYTRMKFLESLGFPRNKIIDGHIFKMPGLDLPRLLSEGVAYGTFNPKSFTEYSYSSASVHP